MYKQWKYGMNMHRKNNSNQPSRIPYDHTGSDPCRTDFHPHYNDRAMQLHWGWTAVWLYYEWHTRDAPEKRISVEIHFLSRRRRYYRACLYGQSPPRQLRPGSKRKWNDFLRWSMDTFWRFRRPGHTTVQSLNSSIVPQRQGRIYSALLLFMIQ